MRGEEVRTLPSSLSLKRKREGENVLPGRCRDEGAGVSRGEGERERQTDRHTDRCFKKRYLSVFAEEKKPGEKEKLKTDLRAYGWGRVSDEMVG